MVCSTFDPTTYSGIAGLLAYPTSCDYHFYAKIMGFIFIIFTFILFNQEKNRYLKGDLLSCMGVSAIAVIFISFIMSLLTIIQADVFIEIIVVGIIIIALWIFKS